MKLYLFKEGDENNWWLGNTTNYMDAWMIFRQDGNCFKRYLDFGRGPCRTVFE